MEWMPTMGGTGACFILGEASVEISISAGLPGGPMVKENPPARAGDIRFNPCPEEDPTGHGATKPVHTATEPKACTLGPVLCTKGSPGTKTKSSPCSPQQESLCAHPKTQHNQKQINLRNKSGQCQQALVLNMLAFPTLHPSDAVEIVMILMR